MNTVAIVGSGMVGRGWASAFARAGFPVAGYGSVDGAAAGALSTETQRSRALAADAVGKPSAWRDSRCVTLARHKWQMDAIGQVPEEG